MKISLIAIMGKSGQLGLDNKMPWYIPEDFKNYKAITLGGALFMGRKTFDSIGRVLPRRTSFVLTRDKAQFKNLPNLYYVDSFDSAIEKAKALGHKEFFINGGGEIYRQYIDQAQELHLSFVDYDGDADTYFPKWEHSKFKVVLEKSFDQTDQAPAWKYQHFLRV